MDNTEEKVIVEFANETRSFYREMTVAHLKECVKAENLNEHDHWNLFLDKAEDVAIFGSDEVDFFLDSSNFEESFEELRELVADTYGK